MFKAKKTRHKHSLSMKKVGTIILCIFLAATPLPLLTTTLSTKNDKVRQDDNE
ncbi:hypothetical protein bcgnr5372_46680 [Bacillus luti]|nr:hypothetical protein [Bacillus cereus]HDR8330590.1 hypothetical protein [Bacillus cereus]HDR8336330.1 hypothetical protein [Bacillus cereus]